MWEGPYRRHGPLWAGGLDLVQHFRSNALVTGWICTALGAAISITIPDAFGLMISFPLGIAGIVLLILGFRADPEEQGLSGVGQRHGSVPDHLLLQDPRGF